MSFLSALRVALSALLVNKGRSVLTSLGIVIGISAVIAMVSAGGGARSKLDDRLTSVGKNLILIRPGNRTNQGIVADARPLTPEDADALRKQLGPLVLGVAPSQMTLRLATSRYGRTGTAIVGSVPDLQPVRNWKVLYGHFYTSDDVKRQARVCLVGQTARKKLFPGRPDPIGERVMVDHVPLRVIGILGEKGRSPTGEDQDNQIFVPISTLERELVGNDHVEIIVTATRSEDLLPRAKERIIEIMDERHHVKPGASPDFDVSTVREMAELAVVVTTVLQILVAIIASISLVVGGIGIMNIMLVSVTERTREIGIRMAVGATGFDVLMQFLLEAIVLALVGGVIGITLGIAGAVGLAHLAGWPVVIEPGTVFLAFGVAAGVGVFFGYYPALKASRLDPIEALRYE